MVRDGDVVWAGGATRVAKNLGVAQRADVKAIVDDANAQTAVLRNQVIGTQSIDITRDPTRLHESAMGNMVADSMRLKYPGVDAALHELRRPAAGPRLSPADRRRAAGRDHLGRGVRGPAVRQPDRDPHADRRAADGRRSSTASPRSAIRPSPAAPAGSRRSPASRSRSTATAPPRSSTGSGRRPTAPAGPLTPIGRRRPGPARHERLHVRRR